MLPSALSRRSFTENFNFTSITVVGPPANIPIPFGGVVINGHQFQTPVASNEQMLITSGYCSLAFKNIVDATNGTRFRAGINDVLDFNTTGPFVIYDFFQSLLPSTVSTAAEEPGFTHKVISWASEDHPVILPVGLQPFLFCFVTNSGAQAGASYLVQVRYTGFVIEALTASDPVKLEFYQTGVF